MSDPAREARTESVHRQALAEYGNVIRAREAGTGDLVATLNSGTMLVAKGRTVSEEQAAPGAKYEGLAGLPLFRQYKDSREVHMSPDAPVLLLSV